MKFVILFLSVLFNWFTWLWLLIIISIEWSRYTWQLYHNRTYRNLPRWLPDVSTSMVWGHYQWSAELNCIQIANEPNIRHELCRNRRMWSKSVTLDQILVYITINNIQKSKTIWLLRHRSNFRFLNVVLSNLNKIWSEVTDFDHILWFLHIVSQTLGSFAIWMQLSSADHW